MKVKFERKYTLGYCDATLNGKEPYYFSGKYDILIYEGGVEVYGQNSEVVDGEKYPGEFTVVRSLKETSESDAAKLAAWIESFESEEEFVKFFEILFEKEIV
jgi:hypothetical protein